MGAVWAIDRQTPARAVYELVTEQHDVALLTGITVLNKLVAKGLLARAKRNDLLHYSTRLSEEEFRTRASRRVVSGILSLGPEAVSMSLVDLLAEQDPGQLAELGRLVRRKLKEQEGS